MQKHSPFELKILEQLKICILPITFFSRCWLLIQQGVKQNDLITQDQSSRGSFSQLFWFVLVCLLLSGPAVPWFPTGKQAQGWEPALWLAPSYSHHAMQKHHLMGTYSNAGKGSKASHLFFPHLLLLEAPLPDWVHWSSLQRTQGGSTAICQLQIKVQLQQCPLQSAAFIGFTREI